MIDMNNITYLDLARVNEEIKTIDVKGKQYSEVAQRINAFRKLFPDGFIRTKLISNENGIAVIQAEVGYYDGIDIRLLGTGLAYEREDSSFINKTSYIENCETSAVGRALGMLGIGIETSVASAEEVQNAINNQTISQEEADSYKLTFGKYKGKTIKEIFKEDEKYINWIIQNTKDEYLLEIIRKATGLYIPTIEEQKQKTELLVELSQRDLDREEIHNKYNVENITDLSIEQLKEIVNG